MRKTTCLLVAVLLITLTGCHVRDASQSATPPQSESSAGLTDTSRPATEAEDETQGAEGPPPSPVESGLPPNTSEAPKPDPEPVVIPVSTGSIRYDLDTNEVPLDAVESPFDSEGYILNTSSFTIAFGPQFWLERLDGDTWIELAYSDNKPNWTSNTFLLKSGEQLAVHDLAQVVDHWRHHVYVEAPQLGNYRIGRSVRQYVDGDAIAESITLYWPFDVV